MANWFGCLALGLLVLIWAISFELNYRKNIESKDSEWGRKAHERKNETK